MDKPYYEIELPTKETVVSTHSFLRDGWVLLEFIGPHRTYYQVIEEYQRNYLTFKVKDENMVQANNLTKEK